MSDKDRDKYIKELQVEVEKLKEQVKWLQDKVIKMMVK